MEPDASPELSVTDDRKPVTSASQLRVSQPHGITTSEVLAVWWSFVWRSTVFGLGFGLALVLILGTIAMMLGHSPIDSALIGEVLAFVVWLGGTVLAMRDALQKQLKRSFSTQSADARIENSSTLELLLRALSREMLVRRIQNDVPTR